MQVLAGSFALPRQPDAYTHNIDDSLKVAAQAVAEGATELHITGGLNTKLPFSYFTDLLSSLKREYPQLHLKAFTMVEFDHFAHFYKMSDEEVIQKLIAGFGFVPWRRRGDLSRTDAFDDLRTSVTPPDGWNSRKGSRSRFKTNATMLYGHIESIEDRVDHLVKLREQQEKSGGFQCLSRSRSIRLTRS